MQKQNNFRLTNQAWLLGFISAAFSTASFAAAGKIEFSVGNVVALNTTGGSRTLSRGTEINAGDTIQTQDGRAQVRFSDGGYISLQPNTVFKVEDYNFSGKADGSEKSFFSLVRGGLRAITGAIGHGSNKTAYRVDTPVATIGIRGTEYLAQFDNKLLVKVGDGAVYLQNSGGDLTLFKGQSGEVGSDGAKPQHSDDTPSVGAAGPTGGKPAQTKEEQQQAQQNQNTFITGDIKTDDGDPCLTGLSSGACGNSSSSSFDMAGQINILNSSNSIGNYTGSASGSGYVATIDYDINFGNYQTFLNFFKLDDGSNSITVTGSGTGSLNSSTGAHTISLVGAGSSTTGSCSSFCSVTALSGQLDSVNGLGSSKVNYSGTFNSSPVSGTIDTVGSISQP